MIPAMVQHCLLPSLFTMYWLLPYTMVYHNRFNQDIFLVSRCWWPFRLISHIILRYQTSERNQKPSAPYSLKQNRKKQSKNQNNENYFRKTWYSVENLKTFMQKIEGGAGETLHDNVREQRTQIELTKHPVSRPWLNCIAWDSFYCVGFFLNNFLTIHW